MTLSCDDCGLEFETLTTCGDAMVCETCLDKYVPCYGCPGTVYIPREDSITIDGLPYCERCAEWERERQEELQGRG